MANDSGVGEALATGGDDLRMPGRDATARRIEEAAARIAANGADQAAGTEAIRVAMSSLDVAIDQTGRSAQEPVRTQERVASLSREMHTGLEGTAAGLAEVAASVDAVRKDADLLGASVESTATTLEETARSIKGVASHASDLARAGEDLVSSATETS